MQKDRVKELLQQYGCGPIQFTGTNDTLYERHLIFDHVIDPKKADLREQFEAAAAQSATSFHNAGFRQKRPTSRRIPSGCPSTQSAIGM